MSLEAGRSLLHYRLTEKIGEGGMGVVWRASDTTLGRDVAIKVLPADFAADAERLARFDREARTLASLNHPHIAGIYGVHQADGLHFLSMELVEGEDLSQRLERGPMSIDEVLRVARDVAIGLEVAHDSGVIHRDLKPANVRLTPAGQAKVLDFGLAKAADPAVSGDISHSPTMTSAGTVAGMIMGTAAYMSPEQAAGQPVDRRVDIWSFGVLLYELLTGQRMFAGETISHTLADVLRAEIDLSKLPASVPRSVVRLLERCLERDASRRLRDIGEARIALQNVIDRPESSESEAAGTQEIGSPPGRTRLAWLVAAIALIAAGGSLSWTLLGDPPAELATQRFTIEMSSGGGSRLSEGSVLAISPDGTAIAFCGGNGTDDVIYLRKLDDFEARPLEGAISGSAPQFSPDGRWILFSDSGRLKKIRPTGGGAIDLEGLPTVLAPFHIASDGYIYYTRGDQLWRGRGEGDEPELLTPPGSEHPRGFIAPHAVPDLGFVLISTRSAPGTPASLIAFDLKSRRWKDLGMLGSDARFLATGHIMFVQANRILTARFDVDAQEITGSPHAVLERASIEGETLSAAVSKNGTVAYLPQSSAHNHGLVYVSTDGDIERVMQNELPVSTVNDPRVSPDGRRIIISAEDSGIWMIDLATQTTTLISEDGFYPLWSPDGKEVVYGSTRKAIVDVYRVPVDLSRTEELLLHAENSMRTMDWVRDGTLVLREEVPDKGMDLIHWTDLDDESSIAPLLQGVDDELAPDVSPDGLWMAYVSDYSGGDEVFVTSFPQTSARLKVSNAGGHSPVWAPDGKTLYYLQGREMIAVNIETDPEFRVTQREVLFDGDFLQYRWSRQYDLMPDGKRFLMILRPPSGKIEVVTNWFQELERLDD